MSELALEQDELLYKLIAGKATNGYQIEIVTVSGESFFGFISGLDRDMIQVFCTEKGEIRGNYKHTIKGYSLLEGTKELGYYIWVPITNIVAIIENRLGIKHFDEPSSRTIKSKQNNFVKKANEWSEKNRSY